MERKYWHSIDIFIDSRKEFGSAIVDWATNKVQKHFPKSIMFFEYTCICTEEKEKYTTPVRKTRKTVIGKTTIEYIRITYKVCILLTVYHEGKLVYSIPSNWDKADFWYLR